MNDSGGYELRYTIFNSYTARGEYEWKGDTIVFEPQGFPFDCVNYRYGVVTEKVFASGNKVPYLLMYEDEEDLEKGRHREI